MSKKDKSLSKSERKALKARERELLAQLEARASESHDYSALKRKALKELAADKSNAKVVRKAAQTELDRRRAIADAELDVLRAARETGAKRVTQVQSADGVVIAESRHIDVTASADDVTPESMAATARDVLARPGSDGAHQDAADVLAATTEATEGEGVDEIRARVRGKKAARVEHTALADSIDRADDDAVREYNRVAIELGGVTLLTSNAERERNEARMNGAQVAEPVETETGTVFEVGAPSEPVGSEATSPVAEPTVPAFVSPSDAPVKPDYETNGNGQYKVQRLTDGKVVGYTRVTTYIDNLDDRTNLEKWKLRVLLEGAAIDETQAVELGNESALIRVRALSHNRDVAVSKARKADRKGKLQPGELATLLNSAMSDFKKGLNALADELLDLGGAKDKAQKGTDIHALCELHDREGIDAVGQLLTDGKISPADLADVEAYARAIAAAGIKVIPELIERPVVLDDIKVAGRLDRGVLYKFPGTGRAVRCVADIKTGRVDYAPGKIAQQLELYARGIGYDLETHEREDLKLSRTKALLIHLPVGSATCTVHIVDLSLGRVGNELSGKVRAWRSEGKRAIDLAIDLATAVSE